MKLKGFNRKGSKYTGYDRRVNGIGTAVQEVESDNYLDTGLIQTRCEDFTSWSKDCVDSEDMGYHYLFDGLCMGPLWGLGRPCMCASFKIMPLALRWLLD